MLLGRKIQPTDAITLPPSVDHRQLTKKKRKKEQRRCGFLCVPFATNLAHDLSTVTLLLPRTCQFQLKLNGFSQKRQILQLIYLYTFCFIYKNSVSNFISAAKTNFFPFCQRYVARNVDYLLIFTLALPKNLISNKKKMRSISSIEFDV